MAVTGIIQRRDTKTNLIADPPLIGEIVYALDTEEFGTTISGTLIWRPFDVVVKSVAGRIGNIILTKDDVQLDQVDNTSDMDKPVSTATNQAIIDAINAIEQADWDETDTASQAYIQNKPIGITLQGNTFNIANALVQLDSNGYLPALNASNLTNLPAIAITDVYSTDNETDQLGLNVQLGDVCVRTDLSETYIALNDTNADMSDWQKLLSPTDSVQSVNGKTGTVILYTSDIDESGVNIYFTDARAINAIGGSIDDNGMSNTDLWSAEKILNTINASNTAHTDTVDPTITDDTDSGFMTGMLWVNTSNNTGFMCLDDTSGAAIWKQFIFSGDIIDCGTF